MGRPLERVQVLLPAAQAFQVKKWAKVSMADAERYSLVPDETRFEIASIHDLDKHGHPLVKIHLTPKFEPGIGWRCGWFCVVDQAVDELIVGHPVKADWPWYRPASFLPTLERAVALAESARMVKIVLEQMKQYTDERGCKAVQLIQGRLEAFAMQWLQYPLGVEPVFFKKQKCMVVQTTSFIPTWRAGTTVVITSVCSQTRTCFVSEDKPIRYRVNRSGRRVVEFDPASVQTVMCWESLVPLW